jgi:hypothetical protein
MRPLLIMLALCLPLASRVQAGDPLKSPECGQAIGELETARSQRNRNPEAVEKARQQAARICFGGTGEAKVPSRVARAPERVPPPHIVPPRAPTAALAAVPAPQPPLEIKRPPVATSCDAGGCWDEKGTRFNRMGPVLVGPGGVCSQHGAFLNCP